jgi:transposase-like protein
MSKPKGRTNYGDETIRAVRAVYVFENASLEAAAARHGVIESTARRWKSEARKAGDDWDKARAAQFMAGGGIEDVVRQTLAVVVRQVQAAIAALEDNPDMPPGERVQNLASLADAYNKLIAASRRVMPETDRLAVAMDVIRRFAEFVRVKKPALAAEFIELIEPFGAELEREYR